MYENIEYKCPNCGVAVYTELCHNCQTKTEVDSFKYLYIL